MANFRGMCTRLTTLRLLNLRRATVKGCGFYKTYPPCVVGTGPHDWYTPLEAPLSNGETYRILFCEPDMAQSCNQIILLDAICNAMFALTPIAGYHDIPDLRDTVCEDLLIPEAVFDDGLNRLLDRTPSPLSVGFHYDGITANLSGWSAVNQPTTQPDQETVMIQLPRRPSQSVPSPYQKLGLRDLPFATEPLIDPNSIDPRRNGEIFATSSVQAEIEKFERC